MQTLEHVCDFSNGLDSLECVLLVEVRQLNLQGALHHDWCSGMGIRWLKPNDNFHLTMWRCACLHQQQRTSASIMNCERTLTTQISCSWMLAENAHNSSPILNWAKGTHPSLFMTSAFWMRHKKRQKKRTGRTCCSIEKSKSWKKKRYGMFAPTDLFPFWEQRTFVISPLPNHI